MSEPIRWMKVLANVEVESVKGADTLEGALLDYFDRHTENPGEERDENGNSLWALGKTELALLRIKDAVVQNLPPVEPVKEPLKVGDRVKKIKGYTITGEVRGLFTMKSGAERVVVEIAAEGGGSFNHIYNAEQLEKIQP